MIILKIDFSHACDYAFLDYSLEKICSAYLFAQRLSLGRSLLGRDIPMLKIGHGKKKLLYVGGVHGSEHLSAGLLIRYAADYCAGVEDGGKMYSLSMKYLFENRTLYIVPMLNPDGVEIAIHGPEADNPLFDRLMRMRPADGFARWQANARGVDLNHNFNAGFEEYKQIEAEKGIGAGFSKYSGEYPESERETAALCNFLRAEDIKMLLAFHTQGEEIYYDYNGYSPVMARAIGAALARMCGYRLTEPEGGAVYGGLKDWFIREFDRPGYTIECGKGENPLPQSQFFSIYATLRELLFTSAVLI